MPRPGDVTSPAIARARPAYGDGSRHSLRMTPSSRSCAAAESGARTSATHLAVALLEQPREDLHAEEARGARQEDGRLHASTSSATGASAVPIAWKPPSTWMISAVIARAASRQQEVDRRRDRRRILDVPAERRLALPRVGEIAEPGDAARGERAERAGGHQVHAHAARAEVARQVARGGLQRRLGHAHPVVDRPGDGGVEVEPDDRRALLGEQVGRARRPAPSASTPTSGTR